MKNATTTINAQAREYIRKLMGPRSDRSVWRTAVLAAPHRFTIWRPKRRLHGEEMMKKAFIAGSGGNIEVTITSGFVPMAPQTVAPTTVVTDSEPWHLIQVIVPEINNGRLHTPRASQSCPTHVPEFSRQR